MSAPNRGFLPELGVVEVATPCPSSWEQMTGDAQVRFCGACKLNVYNLSELTADGARTLLNSTEERLCVRFWVRPDGRLLTRDCPVGLAARARRKVAAVIASIAALLSGWGLLGSRSAVDGPPEATAIPRVEVAPRAPADGPVVGPEWAEERRKSIVITNQPYRVQGKRFTIGVIRSVKE